MRCACYVASLSERTPKRAWSLVIEYDSGLLVSVKFAGESSVPGWSGQRAARSGRNGCPPLLVFADLWLMEAQGPGTPTAEGIWNVSPTSRACLSVPSRLRFSLSQVSDRDRPVG